MPNNKKLKNYFPSNQTLPKKTLGNQGKKIISVV